LNANLTTSSSKIFKVGTTQRPLKYHIVYVSRQTILNRDQNDCALGDNNKNSSGDEIANVNFYAVRTEGTRIR